MRTEPRYIYVLHAGNDLRKIGMSKSPERRIANSLTMTPHQIQLERVIEVVGAPARTVERMAHIRLRDHWVTREWFKVSLGDAIDAILASITEAGASSGCPVDPQVPVVNAPARDLLSPVRMTPLTCVVARTLIGWNQAALSAASGVSRRTISQYELRKAALSAGTDIAIQAAMEDAGIEFRDHGVNVIRERRSEWLGKNQA